MSPISQHRHSTDRNQPLPDNQTKHQKIAPIDPTETILIASATEITAAILSKESPEHITQQIIEDLLRKSYNATNTILKKEQKIKTPDLIPAVPINESYGHDFIICLEDGTRLTALKKHLKQKYDMTLREYYARWKLPDSYPHTAPALSQKRREASEKGRATKAKTRAARQKSDTSFN